MTATLAQHIAARNDTDLLARVVAAAEQANVPNPQQWAEQHIGSIVAAELAGDTSIADVHAYAVSQMPPRPGLNPAAVTDDQIREAVAEISGT